MIQFKSNCLIIKLKGNVHHKEQQIQGLFVCMHDLLVVHEYKEIKLYFHL